MADGVEVGRAHVKITPDASTAAFAAQGRLAAGAFAAPFDSELSSGVQRTMRGIYSQISRQHSQSERDAKSLAGFTAQAATEMHRQFGNSFDILSRGAASLGSDVQRHVGGGATAAGASLSRSFSSAASTLSRLSYQIGITGFQLQLMGGLLSAGITLPVVGAGAAIAKMGLQTAMTLEDGKTGLQALLPVGYDIEALMKRLTAFSVSSPIFSVDEVVTFTRGLVGAGVGIEQAERILESLNKTFITFGVTGDRAQLVLRAIGQVFSKGKVSAEEMNQQIGEQIPLWGLLDRVAQQPIGTFASMNATQAMTSEQFGRLVEQVGNLPEISRGAEAGVSTLNAQLAIMKESFKTRIGLAFLDEFPRIKTSLDSVMPLFERFTTWVISKIPEAIMRFGQIAQKALELKQRWDELSPSTQAIIAKIAALSVVLGPALLILGNVATVVSTITGVAGLASGALGGMSGGFAGVAKSVGPLLAVAAGIAIIGAGLFLAYKSSEDFRGSIQGFVDGWKRGWEEKVKPAFDGLKQAISQDLVPAWEKFAQALGFPNLRAFGEWLGESFAGALGVVISLITDLVEFDAKLITFFANFAKGAKDGATEADGFGTKAGAVAGDVGRKYVDFATTMSGVYLDVGRGAGELAGDIGHWFGEMGGDAGGLAATVGEKFGEIGGGLKDKLVSGVKDGKEKVTGFFGEIRDYADGQMEKPLGVVFRNISAQAVESADEVKDFALTKLKEGFEDTGEAGQGLWRGLTGIWDGIATYFSTTWNQRIAPIFDAVWGKVTGLAGIFWWFRDEVIAPVWNWIGDRISNAVDFISRLWDWLKDKLKIPINIIIGFINSGVIKPYNKVASLVPFMPPISEIPELARGGAVRGPGTGTSDSILAALSNGEFVMSAEAVKRWGTGFLNAMNQGRPVLGFAGGGSVNETAMGLSAGLADILRRMRASGNAGDSSIRWLESAYAGLTQKYGIAKGSKIDEALEHWIEVGGFGFLSLTDVEWNSFVLRALTEFKRTAGYTNTPRIIQPPAAIKPPPPPPPPKPQPARATPARASSTHATATGADGVTMYVNVFLDGAPFRKNIKAEIQKNNKFIADAGRRR